MVQRGEESGGTAPLVERLAALRRAAETGPVIADPASVALHAMAARAATTEVPILVTGPSGAGKEEMARFLHRHSRRAAGPFVALNCAALPEAMAEALLFGHARGAFTGALGSAPGLFRAAHGGTIFLDELGELPLPLQAKLLRAIEQREVLPLGETAPVAYDARLVCATNRDLPAEVEAGRFRVDLYWRLAAFPLDLPPLSARPADILPLIARFLPRQPISEAALETLIARDWPGNVRELANALQRAAILAADAPILPCHLPAAPRPEASPEASPEALPDRLRTQEADAIHAALAVTGGRREAARRLGISERTLRYKLAAIAGRPRAASPTNAHPTGAMVLQ